jgi:TonB family protein
MPTIPPQLDETPPKDAEGQLEPLAPVEPLKPDAPLSFVPHDAEGQAVAPRAKIRTTRFGELDEHELLHLLNSIDDERARARFRESVYISLFVWIAVVLLIFFGPKYLWHAPQVISPADALLKQQRLTTLTNPVLPHHASPAPKIDKGTLNKLREMTRKASPAPAAPAPTPAPAPEAHQPAPTQPSPTPPQPLPLAPSPLPRSSAPPVPDTPLPQPVTKPNFNTGGTVSDQMRNLASNPAPRAGSSGAAGISGYTRGVGRGASAGVGGPEILSDTRGVDFNPYLARLMRQIYQQWIPLIPEEAQPPISKQGVTQIRFTINPDGSLAAIHLDGPSGDVALDRAAWGSVNGQIFPPLPKQFLGPNLELRIHYLVNTNKE